MRHDKFISWAAACSVVVAVCFLQACNFPSSGDLSAVTGANDTPAATVAVPVVVNGPLGNSALTFDPTFYSFPTLATNAGSATKSFTVTNSSTYVIVLGTITGANSQFSLTANTCSDGLVLEPDATCAFTVRFAPATSGILSTAFSIPYDVTPGANGFSSNLGVSGAGTTLTSFAGLDSLNGETPTTIKLNWTDFAGAATYQVYRVSDGVPNLIATVISANLVSGLGCATGACSYTASGLSPLTSYAFRVRATDFFSVQELNIRNLTSTTTAGFLNLTGATSVGAGVCTALTVSIQDATPALVNVGADTTIAMTGLGSGAVYSDAGCTTPLANPVIAAGTSSKIFYFKDNTPQSLTLIGSLASFTNATKSLTVIPKLAFTTQPSATGDTDTVLVGQPVVTVQDGTGATVASAANSITLTTYSDAACTVPVTGGVTATANPLAATSGVATFAGVKILRTSTIRLGASGANLASACSSTMTISAGAVAAANSSVTWVPASLIANNVATSAITVTLKDASGNGVPGKTVTATSDRGTDTISGSGGSTNSSGVVNLTARSSSTGSSAITVVGNGTAMNPTVQVQFLAATPLTDYQARLFDGLNPGSNSSSLKSIWKDLARSAATYDGSLSNFLFDATSGWSGAPRTYRDEVLSDNPVGYWRLGETSGGTAYDISGNAFNGIYATGSTLGVTGALANDTDQAVTFNGTSGYLENTSFPDQTTFTVSAWIKTSRQVTDWTGIVEFSNNTNQRSGIGLNAVGLPIVLYGGTYNISTGVRIDDQNWHHVVGIWNGTTSSLFVDGNVVALGSSDSAGPGLRSTIDIGKMSFGTFYGFPGSIDEVAIYNTALSTSRILAHYNAGMSTDRPLIFDGSTSNSYVDFGTGVNNNANFSFETWIAPANTAATGKVILSNGTTTNSGASNETNTGLTLRQSKTFPGKLELYLGESGEKAYAQEVLTDAPVGYWKLNETSGTTVKDSSGKTQTGSYIGTPTLGQAGPYSSLDTTNHSVLLNGSSQYIDIPYNMGLSGQATVAFWINETNPDSKVINYPVSIGNSGSERFGVYVGGSSYPVIGAYDGVYISQSPTGSFTTAADGGVWRHIAVVYDKNASPRTRFYKDGVDIGSAADAVSGDIATQNQVNIGRNVHYGFYVGGSIAEVAVFNTALSPVRILAQYNAALATYASANGLQRTFCTSTPALSSITSGTSFQEHLIPQDRH